MSSSKLIRWGGVAAVVIGLLGFVDALLLLRYGDPPSARAALYAREVSFGGTAVLLAVYAFATRHIHLQDSRDFGRLGTTAVFLVVLSGVLLTGKTLIVLAALVTGANMPFFIFPVFMLPGTLGALVGPVLLGIAILRAGVMPAWFGWLQTLSVPLMLATNVQGYGGVAGGVALTILGVALLRGRVVRNAAPLPREQHLQVH